MIYEPLGCFGAAFEATRFYNVSENSPLARELCDGPTCNEVESSTNQWAGEMSRPPKPLPRPPLPSSASPNPSFFWIFVFFSIQDSSRPTSATTCSAAWRSSGSSAARATGTAATTGSPCAAPTVTSTRTCVRWRCLRAETGRASSRPRRPSVLTVRGQRLCPRERPSANQKRGGGILRKRLRFKKYEWVWQTLSRACARTSRIRTLLLRTSPDEVLLHCLFT